MNVNICQNFFCGEKFRIIGFGKVPIFENILISEIYVYIHTDQLKMIISKKKKKMQWNSFENWRSNPMNQFSLHIGNFYDFNTISFQRSNFEIKL